MELPTENEVAHFVRLAAKRQEDEAKAAEQKKYEADMRAHCRSHLGRLLDDELARLTKRSPMRESYVQDLKRFKQFCDEIQMPWRPAAPEIVAWFLLDQEDRGANVNTIRRLVAAISHAHKLAECFDPTQDVLVEAMLKWIGKKAKQNRATATTEHASAGNAQLEGAEIPTQH